MPQGIVEPSSQSASQDQNQKHQGVRVGERSKMVQRLLDAAPDLPAFITDLLATQAVTVVGTEAAAFIIERNERDNTASLRAISHIRPDESDADTRAKAIEAFQGLVHRCIGEGKDGAIEVGEPNAQMEPQYCLITLLRDGPDVIAVSAVITRCMNLDRARQRLTSMQLVAGYFELFSLRKTAEQNRVLALNHQRVLQLSRSVADAEGFQSSAMNLCNELANATGASRVAIGWVKGSNVKVKALSHTEEFDKKQELIVQLEKTMEECVDQETPVYYNANGQPGPGGFGSDSVTRQAALLSRAQGSPVVLSIPLRKHAEIEGVLTLEFLSVENINPKLFEGLGLAADLLAPQLFDRHENDRWIATKFGLRVRHWTEELIGPRHWVAKLIAFAAVIALLVLTNTFNLPKLFPTQMGWADVRMMYHVSAPLTMAAENKRSICSPFEGQIDQVFERPGKHVEAGKPLFSLKVDEFKMKLFKARTEKLTHDRQAQAYRADKDKFADYKIETEKANQAQAEVDLYQYQIDHATVYAPFDGEILKGDLEDKKNTVVREGEELMTFGSLTELRAELSVTDLDIQDVTAGQQGTIATTARPTDKRAFIVSKVIPNGTPKEGNNVFTVYGTFNANAPIDWRPGMTGEARINVEKRTIAWIWTHRLIDFVRLKTWL